MSWWAVGAALVAAAGTAYNTSETAKKQDRAVSRGILQRMEATREQSSAMQKALAQLRESNAQPATQEAKGAYLKALAAHPTMGTQPAQVGALSDAYRQAAGAAAKDSAALADKTAGLMAVTDAPAFQRQAESGLLGRLQGQLQGLGINANDATNQAMLKAKGITRNPWIDLASAALSGYASGAASQGGGSTTMQSPSSAGYYEGGSFAGGGNYTGPGSLSTNYAGNVRNLYGLGG